MLEFSKTNYETLSRRRQLLKRKMADKTVRIRLSENADTNKP
jgi:hypothetical protein